ncbi:aspartyl-phosphate phosphatase Spo0E family protein [Lederbergia lenta]|uniref:Sporulation stage 0, Spo0E-like regulatory phosphatase n=1 Tax=Lederbergia lenta TaxID=1467 RepID=A0A2X4W7I1_LEDLE|nr:aspartyl-phosphate phosphatase Spo0E family protein [Lederbergia lenta]MCM3110334.1 aspartyl-phosphate phosphatase Spo0E family protein [Lederbergia lenta]MEC2324098.1 aspartyl-phosphate phosphatase Spo0E family protein [Lederbergia lenta]SQI60617.1 Sporulation stage 0, Spo0E-like regulatory phosphatase [Lederbergia lenta]
MLDRSKEQKHTLMLIQKKREEMCLYGKKYGLCATETINSSQDLDELLNEYYRLYQSQEDIKNNYTPHKISWIIYQKQEQYSTQ